MMEDFVYAPRFCRSLPAFFLFAETGCVIGSAWM